MTNTENEQLSERKRQKQTENLERFIPMQPYNMVSYACEDCGEVWGSYGFLKAFKDRKPRFDGFVTGDWHQIKRTIIENLFRPKDDLLGVVCPKCSLETSHSGNISLAHCGTKQDMDELDKMLKENSFAFEKALSLLYQSGKKVDQNGWVVSLD